MKKKEESFAKETVVAVGRVLGAALRLAGQVTAESPVRHRQPGASPGIERAPEVDQAPAPGTIAIRCIDYGVERVESRTVEDLDGFLAAERPAWCAVRWINVDGLHANIINRFREKYGFHTLAAEDALHVPQRAKQEPYDGHLFIVLHMLTLREGMLADEQVSIMFFENTVLTFQERSGDVWDPVRQRIEQEGSRLRKGKTGYLVYALLDAIVDNFFPILEHYGDVLEAIEERIADNATPAELQQLYGTKRELVLLRRVMWPTRQMLDELHRSEFVACDKQARTYMRDVYDHAIQVIDMIETYREMAGGLTDLYMSSISNRMNEIMKVLTIMASLFIPVTFLAGIYGMNFEYIPELGFKWSYPLFWGVCLSILVGLLIFFRRKGWIGGR